MAAMSQRRKLSTKGRLIAAGLSIGAAGVLAGAMAISDHTASASPPTVANDAGLSSPSATPYTPSQQTPTQPTPTQPTPTQQTPTFQPHTRSGGS